MKPPHRVSATLAVYLDSPNHKTPQASSVSIPNDATGPLEPKSSFALEYHTAEKGSISSLVRRNNKPDTPINGRFVESSLSSAKKLLDPQILAK